MAAPSVTVVVPVRDDAANLRACLAALARCDPRADEVVVVDDASASQRDAIVGLASEFDARLVLLDANAGPAAARNRGADVASGEVLFFVDADCEAHADAVGRVRATLAAGSPFAATFGSYDADPLDRHPVSVWKNLAHRHTHQAAAGESRTFWSGCGAVRRDVFLEFGGFDEGYGRPSIEDVELGLRLTAAGRRVVLDPHLQVRHRKRWTLVRLLRTDLFDRAIPWARLLARHPGAGADLNLRASQKLAALAAPGLLASLAVAAVLDPLALAIPFAWAAASAFAEWRAGLATPAALLAVTATAATPLLAPAAWPALLAAAGCLAVILAANRGLYRLLVARAGVAAAALSVVPQVGHYLAALAGFAAAKLSRGT